MGCNKSKTDCKKDNVSQPAPTKVNISQKQVHPIKETTNSIFLSTNKKQIAIITQIIIEYNNIKKLKDKNRIQP